MTLSDDAGARAIRKPPPNRQCPDRAGAETVASGPDGWRALEVVEIAVTNCITALLHLEVAKKKENSRGRTKLYPSADHGKGDRWQVRWRDADGKQCKRNFAKAMNVFFAGKGSCALDVPSDAT